MKLQRQLVLLLIAALLPLVALSVMLGAGSLTDRQRAMRQDAMNRVSILAAGVDRELSAQAEVLQAVAQAPGFDSASNTGWFDAYARRLLARQPMWTAVTLLAPDGVRVADVPSLPPAVPRTVLDRAAFEQALRTQKPVVGQINRFGQLDPAFAIFAPVVRDGRVTYVLSAVIKPAAIQQLLHSDSLPRAWRAGVIDSSGRLVARTDRTQDRVGRPASQTARDALARATTGIFRVTTPDGVPMVTAFRVLPASRWSAYVSIPEARYAAPFTRALWLVGAGVAGSVGLAVLFLLLLWRELKLRQRESQAVEESHRLEALGRMTGGVAHDFNNLLMIVQGSAEMLKRRLAGQERVEGLVDAVLTASQRGQTLTRQLLAFGRRSAHQPESFRLQDRVEELHGLLQRSTSATVKLTLEAPADTWPLHADPSALEVALINLAVNARDAMPDGGRLTIAARNATLQKGRDEGTGLTGDFVALSASDTGPGIPEEHLAHIFEPFFTTKPAGKGTGLGLSQVYGFARQSGGAVTVDSRPGEGVTFTIYLPRGEGEVAPPPSAEPGAEAVRAEGRVLLVEDNREVAEVVRSMLESAGYEVVWAADARAALDIAMRGSVDAVVSDVMLGRGVSGLELAERLRERRSGLPTVLMTGYSEALARSSGRGFPVIAKPFGQAELQAALGRARRSVGGATTSQAMAPQAG